MEKELVYPAPGTIFRHYKNNNVYVVTGKCKLQVDDVWVDGVLYTPFKSEEIFVRTLKEFLDKFKIGF